MSDVPVMYLIQCWKAPTASEEGVHLSSMGGGASDGAGVDRYFRVYYTLAGDYTIHGTDLRNGLILAGEGAQYVAYKYGAQVRPLTSHEGVGILEELMKEDNTPNHAQLPGDKDTGSPPKSSPLQRFLE